MNALVYHLKIKVPFRFFVTQYICFGSWRYKYIGKTSSFFFNFYIRVDFLLLKFMCRFQLCKTQLLINVLFFLSMLAHQFVTRCNLICKIYLDCRESFGLPCQIQWAKGIRKWELSDACYAYCFLWLKDAISFTSLDDMKWNLRTNSNFYTLGPSIIVFDLNHVLCSESGKFCAIKEVRVIFDDSKSKERLRQLNQVIFCPNFIDKSSIDRRQLLM